MGDSHIHCVIPAKAGIQAMSRTSENPVWIRLRGNDVVGGRVRRRIIR